MIDEQAQPVVITHVVYIESIDVDYTIYVLLKISDATLAENYCGKQFFLKIEYREDYDQLVGVVTNVKKLKDTTSDYELTVQPAFCQLTQSKHSRSFVDWTVLQIIRFVMDRHPNVAIDCSCLHRHYQPLAYVIQFEESDYYFLRRIMAEQGIYYCYRQHTLMLCDDVTGYADYQRPLQNIIRSRKRFNLLPEKLWLQSAPSLCSTLQANHTHTTQVLYPSIASNQLERDAECQHHYHRIKQTELELELVSDYLGLHVGSRFFYNKYYVVKQACHQLYIDRGVVEYSHQCICIPADRLLCLPFLSRPCIKDYLQARVTAIEAGSLGRIKLRYDWDERQQDSPWCSVRQYWCGDGFGSLFLPKLNDRVHVQYINGDLARPVAMGSDVQYFEGLKLGAAQSYCTVKQDQLAVYAEGLFSVKSHQAGITAQHDVTIQNLGSKSSLIEGAKFIFDGEHRLRFQVGSSYLEISGDQLTLAAESIELND